MADRVREGHIRHAMDALLAEQAGYARYQLSQLEATRGGPERARRLQFDESGYAIPRTPGLAQRVARLLRP